MRPRDIVVDVAGKPVKSLAELEALSKQICEGKTRGVPTLVTFERRAKRYLTVVKIGPIDEESRVPQVRKAWFPAATQVFTRRLAEAMGLKGAKGVRLTMLYPQLKAGPFEVGDILTHIDGMAIDASEPSHADVFPTMIRRYKAGAEVDFRVIRRGQTMKIPYALLRAPRPSQEMARHRDDRFEFAVRDLCVMDRIEMLLSQDQTGVLLNEVKPGGWAALAALRLNDIMLNINDAKIETVSDFRKAMNAVAKEKPEFVRFFVKRGIHTFFAEVRPDWSRAER